MSFCSNVCNSYRTDTINNAWIDIRAHFGPIVNIGSFCYVEDVDDWVTWATSKNISTSDIAKFAKWLIWKCTYGTIDYGNLPHRIRGHVGISYIPCPFDSNNYDEIRSVSWLGYIPTTLSDHGKYYMKVSNRGSVWGHECTSPDCVYLIEHGRHYFHI